MDITHAESSFGYSDNWRKEVTVSWAGASPTTQQGCEDTEGSAILYDYDDSSPHWVSPERKSAVGQWVKVSGVPGLWTCALPRFTYTVYPTPYTRIAGTMRRISGGNPTVAVKFTVAYTLVPSAL